VLSVRDSGVGIPVNQLDSVFGLFYQAEDPVSRRTGGMGLGLYISKEIVTRHNGRIWAESEPGKGSTFNIALPRNGDSKATNSTLTPSLSQRERE
jgi:signal transduction histidine kinase